MRILLADDEMNVRSALRLLLEQESGMSIAAEATNYNELLSAVKKGVPDLILLDWELPGQRDSESLLAVHALYPGTLVVVLSSQPEIKKKAIAAGATAFVSKEEPPERLLSVIRKIYSQNKTIR